jgi:predicted DsbA family dithiol-disulfide isomerase
MKVTYYLEVLSSWCHAAEPAWAELKTRYSGRVDFEWRIALMTPGDFLNSHEQNDWIYGAGSGPAVIYACSLSSQRKGLCIAHDLVAEAGRDFGVSDDRIRLALARAGLLEGRLVGDMKEAIAVGAKAAGLDAGRLRARAESVEVLGRVEASTAEFNALHVGQRPAFVIEDPAGDKVVVSGLVSAQPLISSIETMLADEAAQASYTARHQEAPAA